MDIFEQIQEIKQAREKVERLDKNFEETLYKKFMKFPNEIRKLQVNYEGNYISDRDIIEVYYPILDVSVEFTKKNENFYRVFHPDEFWIEYEYTLLDEKGRKIIVLEKALLGHIMYKLNENPEFYHSFIPIGDIEFNIIISRKKYSLTRKINQEQLINKIKSKYNFTYLKLFSN